MRGAEIRRYRRFKGYDYSRGAVVFVTFAVAGRKRIFGKVEGDKVVYSKAGEVACAVLAKEAGRTPDARLMRWVIMPDHVHLRFYLRPGQQEPLKKLGRFVYNFKAWTRNNLAKIGIEMLWEKNYHDRICLSREIIILVDKYIDNNPLKWSLMHGNPPPLKVVEPMSSDSLPLDEWWTGVGRVDWLSAPGNGGAGLASASSGCGLAESDDHLESTAQARAIPRFAAVRLSRTIPAADFGKVVARLVAAAEKGWTLCSTWISPCERAVFAELAKRGAAVVRGSQDPLEMVYRPKEDEPSLFAEGRYLLLSRVFADGTPRGAGWHGMNDALARMALAQGGVSAYVRWSRHEGLVWEFDRGEAGLAPASSGCLQASATGLRSGAASSGRMPTDAARSGAVSSGCLQASATGLRIGAASSGRMPTDAARSGGASSGCLQASAIGLRSGAVSSVCRLDSGAPAAANLEFQFEEE